VSDLTLDAVTVQYGAHQALTSLTCTVPSGGWLCLIGPNGAGKSSALRAVVGLVEHQGSVHVGDQDLVTLRARRRAQLVSHVPQSPLMPDDMTVAEYALLGRNPYIGYFGTSTRSDREIAHHALGQLDLHDFNDRRLDSLSGGEKQRLSLARAVTQGAPVLVLDEPTSALDIGHQQQALELVDRMRRSCGLTVISAMHDLTLAGLYADTLILLHEGRSVAAGSPAEVLRAEILSEFYGVSVRVHVEADGAVVVVPQRSRS
jgi:iron complex transport system ATP-binding protein